VFQNFLEGDENQYFSTGDLGFVLDGELFITGRIKDLMIFNGINYYPHDIEAIVELSHKHIQKSCTAAFSVDSIQGQEKLVIVAELTRSAMRKEHLHEEVIDAISGVIRPFP